ncbi:MAG: NfeD family protein [Lentisphaeria bacterium]
MQKVALFSFVFWMNIVFLGTAFAQKSSVNRGTVSSQKSRTVFVLPIKGAINKSMLFVFRRAFREAETLQPAAIILEMNTPGGALRETREIIQWIRSVRKKGCPVYAFVNPDALSAGAMISMSTDGIYMAENATIGSAMPIAISPLSGGIEALPADVKEKMMSAVRGMVRSLAEENGYRKEVAIAMVDPNHPDLDYGDTFQCPKGKILNLTAREAIAIPDGETKPILATAMVSGLTAMLNTVGFGDAAVVSFKEEQADKFARWITSLGPFLLALAILALWIEFKIPGFGIFGFSGIALLALYFFGYSVAGLAGWEEVILIGIGIILLALEIFVIPGFGIAGISGFVCIVIGGGMAVVPQLPKMNSLPGLPSLGMDQYFSDIVWSFGTTLFIFVFGLWLLNKILPKTSLYRAIILQDHLDSGDGFGKEKETALEQLVGKMGRTKTLLRPAGVVVVEHKSYDVVSDGEFIPRGAAVIVKKISGTSLVVERQKEKTDS